MTTAIDLLITPFRFGFMADALIISLLVAVPAALLSCFLVLKGWSLLGDAISHAVLPGVVISYALGLPYVAGAFAAGLACAVGTGYIGDHSRVKPDTVMGVVYSGMFGAGLVLYVWIRPDVHLDHILFGDMLGVARADILLSGGIALVTTAAIAVKWRDLQLHAFDPVQARAVGLPTRLLHYGLLCLISATVVGALAAVGIILVIALLIAPGAIALLVTRSLGRMLLVAVTVAAGASAAGLIAAFYIDAAPAPTIVLLLAAGFVAAFAISGQRAAIAARG
ncbi:metal ABC transporter permease [Tistrella mobilis]|uniref:metal ABC transporter permease n=1 Tax=Tistrella mobilis TaxID=171437 RepID=UPI003555CAF2